MIALALPLAGQVLQSMRSGRSKLIVVDGLYSMDGDLAPLAKIVDLAGRYDCMTMVDDSHGTGVLGGFGAYVVGG